MVNNQKPYSNEDWHEKKVNHKFNKMLFSILDLELNDKFYNKKWNSTSLMMFHLLNLQPPWENG
jgi:hypothetical protein